MGCTEHSSWGQAGLPPQPNHVTWGMSLPSPKLLGLAIPSVQPRQSPGNWTLLWPHIHHLPELCSRLPCPGSDQPSWRAAKCPLRCDQHSGLSLHIYPPSLHLVAEGRKGREAGSHRSSCRDWAGVEHDPNMTLQTCAQPPPSVPLSTPAASRWASPRTSRGRDRWADRQGPGASRHIG